MSELTYLLLRLGFLALLWFFVFITIFAIRSELFGPKVRALPEQKSKQVRAAAVAAKQQAPVAPAPVAPAVKPGAKPITDPADLIFNPDSMPTSAAVDSAPTEMVGAIPVSQPSANATSLSVIEGPSAGITIRVGSEPITIGRAPDCGLRITDDYTSNYHARLIPSASGWFVEDTGSTNGTKLDGRDVHGQQPVRPGQLIQIGTNVLELRG